MPADESTTSEEDDEEQYEDDVDSDEEHELEEESDDDEAAAATLKTAQEAAALLKRQDLSDLISKFETVFPGDGENFPNNGDLCKVHYTARIVGTTDLLESRKSGLFLYLKTGNSRRRGRPFTFKLGTMQVVQGWEECFPKMSHGQHVIITCPPEVCYGEAGYPPNIPPNVTIEYDIEFIISEPDQQRSAFSLRVYLDDDGLRNTEDTDDKLDKSMLEEGEAADSDEYSDSLESVVEQAVEEEESDLEDSDSYDGDVAPDTFAQYNFIDEKTKNR